MSNHRKRKRIRRENETDTYNESNIVTYNFGIIDLGKKIQNILEHNKKVETEIENLKNTNEKLKKDNTKLKKKIKNLETYKKENDSNNKDNNLKEEVDHLTVELQNLLNEVRSEKNNSILNFSYIS